jgi:hypothetical protein
LASDALILARAASAAIVTARFGMTRTPELSYASESFRVAGARLLGVVLIAKRESSVPANAALVFDGRSSAGWTPRGTPEGRSESESSADAREGRPATTRG